MIHTENDLKTNRTLNIFATQASSKRQRWIMFDDRHMAQLSSAFDMTDH